MRSAGARLEVLEGQRAWADCVTQIAAACRRLETAQETYASRLREEAAAAVQGPAATARGERAPAAAEG